MNILRASDGDDFVFRENVPRYVVKGRLFDDGKIYWEKIEGTPEVEFFKLGGNSDFLFDPKLFLRFPNVTNFFLLIL